VTALPCTNWYSSSMARYTATAASCRCAFLQCACKHLLLQCSPTVTALPCTCWYSCVPASYALLLLQTWFHDKLHATICCCQAGELTHCDCLAMHQLIQLVNGQVHKPITIWAATRVTAPAALQCGGLARSCKQICMGRCLAAA
jgi:hypothetical protein